MQICHYSDVNKSICQGQMNWQRHCEVMPDWLCRLPKVISRPIDWQCLKRNLIIFKTNSLYIHDLFIASFDFFWCSTARNNMPRFRLGQNADSIFGSFKDPPRFSISFVSKPFRLVKTGFLLILRDTPIQIKRPIVQRWNFNTS